MPDRGPNNEEPAKGLDTVGVNHQLQQEASDEATSGFDWASRAHDVTVLDEAGGVLDRWAFPHSETGWVDHIGPAGTARIRRPRCR